MIVAAAFVLAVMQTKTYWLMYGLYTFGLVLVLAPPGQVASEAEERGVQILTGIPLLVVGLVIVDAAGRWLDLGSGGGILKGTIEDIPLPDESVDVVITNCEIHLSVDEPKGDHRDVPGAQPSWPDRHQRCNG